MIRHIQAGELNIQLTCGQERFDSLLAFASRENHKRGFLFVSRVLGKHIPVKPHVMREIYDSLADSLVRPHATSGNTPNSKPNKGNTFVIGMAETATGLGAGIADSLARQNPGSAVYYQHTTRHHLADHPIWFEIKESHSHAVDHLIYQPNPDVMPGIKSCEQLVLIDDEATTGKTLYQLAEKTLQKIPAIKKLKIVTLANWLSAERQAIFQALPVPVEFVHLIHGTFNFTPNASHQVQTPKTVDNDICRLAARTDLGRTGLKMPYAITPEDLTLSSTPAPVAASTSKTPPTVIVGTGEHLYLPFLIAEELEQAGLDVHFQSTTRSPILMGDAIARKIRFTVKDQKENYIYNLPQDRTVHVLCENAEQATHNGLFQGQFQDSETDQPASNLPKTEASA